MPSYTAVLFTNPDGSHNARLLALPGCEAEGPTRGDALRAVTQAAAAYLAERAKSGQRPPREEWAPARTVRVQDPRRGDSIPYVAAIERVDNDKYRATAVLFPDLQGVGETIDEAISLLGPRIYLHLSSLLAQGRRFPTQDDAHAYVVTVPDPRP